MTDVDRDLHEESTAGVVERSIRLIAIAIAMAGALIALAIYWRPSPPHYQVVTMGDQIVRLNTRSGTMVACNVQKCGFVIHGSDGIDENRGYALLPPQAAAPPAQPARQPATAPAAPAVPRPH